MGEALGHAHNTPKGKRTSESGKINIFSREHVTQDVPIVGTAMVLAPPHSVAAPAILAAVCETANPTLFK